MTERKIIEGCLIQDSKSQRMLFDNYSYPLFQVSMRYSDSKMDAEDVLQEAWVKIFNGLKNYRDEGKFLSWMKTIVIRVALRKKESFWFRNERADIENVPQQGFSPGVVEKMSADEILDQVIQLPSGYKEVFKLFVIDGFSHKEIGRLMNIAESTSRVKLTVARKWMRESILKSNKIYVHES